MKKLLNVLYVTKPDAYLSLDNKTVVVSVNKQDVFKIPLLNLEGIVSYSYSGASPALMFACAENNISLCYMTENGRFLARVSGRVKGNVILRKKQYQISDNIDDSAEIAKYMISAKAFNSRWVLERLIRDHPLRIDGHKLKKSSDEIYDISKQVLYENDLEIIRGHEGRAANCYFSVFDHLILQQKEKFAFNGRNRRPPQDNVNALLSFMYSILANDVASSLEAVGLDPYVGFLHRDRPGRISLALDLMEEFRAVIADRFVLTLINKKIVNETHFIAKPNSAVELTDDARKIILNAWQEKKSEEIKHPYLQEKIKWGLVPHVQAQLLARFIRGDLDAYPAFIWK